MTRGPGGEGGGGADENPATVAPAASHGFPSSARLRRSAEFKQALANGRKRTTQAFVLYAANGAGRSRLGITVSRKVGKAVVRNRIKRLIRETFRLGQGEMAQGMEFVVIARIVAATLDNDALRRELSILFKPYLPRPA